MKTEILFAIKAAKRSVSSRRIGASARRSDGVIVSSHNGRGRTPIPHGHAEVRLARKLDVGARVIVIRLKKDGSLAMARPCANCERRLRLAGVGVIWYSDDRGEVVRL